MKTYFFYHHLLNPNFASEVKKHSNNSEFSLALFTDFNSLIIIIIIIIIIRITITALKIAKFTGANIITTAFGVITCDCLVIST